MLTLQIESTRWRMQAQKMIATLGVDQRTFLRDQFRLLLDQIGKFTPPNFLAQGRKRVKADIAKIAQPFDDAKFHSKRLAEIIRTGDHRAFAAFAIRAKKDWPLVRTSHLPSLHAAARDNRGRVRRSVKPPFIIGRADATAFRRYVAAKQSKVGLARSGWAPALLAVGGTVPDWVARHGLAHGAVEDRTSDPTNPTLTARNRTPWASRRDEGERILANALASRRRAMETNLRALVRAAAQKSGLAA